LEYCRSLSSVIQAEELLSSYPVIKENFNYLLEAIEDISDHYILSHDRDARYGHKTKSTAFFGYKTHIALTEERIITAAVVTSGEKNDGKQMPQLLEENKNNGIDVDNVIADTAYCNKRNLEVCKTGDIRLVSRLHPNLSGTHDPNDGFTFNKDAGMFVCPAGHMSYKRNRHGKKIKNSNQYYAYYFDVKKCINCIRKKGCYKEGCKTKSYNVSIKTPEQEKQILFQKTIYFRIRNKGTRLKPRMQKSNSVLDIIRLVIMALKEWKCKVP